jgi:hypothetical protein
MVQKEVAYGPKEDKILEKLRKGIFPSEIREEFPDAGKTCEALREFLAESDRIVEERQQSLKDLRARPILSYSLHFMTSQYLV